MATEGVFACPSCGASLTYDGKQTYVKCKYCGNTVIVPEELRPKQAPDIQQAPVIMVQVGAGHGAVAARRGSPLLVLVILVLVLGSAGLGIFFMTSAVQNTASAIIPLFTTMLPTEVNISLVDASTASRGRTATPTAISARSTAVAVSSGVAEYVLSFGQEGTGPGFFQDPRGIAVDNQGNLFVADYSTGRIQQFDENGKFINSWLLDNAKFPILDLAADRNGNFYVVSGGQIHKYSSKAGKFVTKFGSSTSFYREAVALPDGNLLVLAASADDDLIRLNAQGREVGRIRKIVSSQTDSPESSGLRVAVDGLGNLFVLSRFSTAVFRFTSAGKYVNRFGKRGDKPNDFRSPDDIAIDAQGRVYVADSAGILVFDPDGAYLDLIKFPTGSGAVRALAFTDKNVLFATMGSNKVFKLALKTQQ